ncbi:TerB family tellurite resistance protein [Flavobacteriaceae bacterium]|nr:TerB family tellurite resistance protein [Flavobacteriaceae bacterium]
MSFSNLYTPGFKSRNRDHFAAIIRIAQADGIISKEEESFINRTAVNLEIEDSEVIKIKANIDSYPINPPITEQSRLERLYDLSRMVFADNIADDAEKNLLKRLIIGLGFAVDKVDQVIEKSFLEISKGSDEEEFIASFR